MLAVVSFRRYLSVLRAWRRTPPWWCTVARSTPQVHRFQALPSLGHDRARVWRLQVGVLARRAASAAAHDERLCRGLLLTGLPQVRPHMRRDGPMCCSIARRLLPPSSLHSFPTDRRLAWCASQWQELRGRLLHSFGWERGRIAQQPARASRPAIFIAAFTSSAPDHDQLRPTASASGGFAHIAMLCLRLCFTGAASGAICRLLLTTAGVIPQSDSNR